MKKFTLFLMLLLAFAWGILVATLLFQFGVVQAQEGCGRWVEVEQGISWNEYGSDYVFEWLDSLLSPDSVWVPEKCLSVKSGYWEYRWVMQPCMRSLLLGDIQTLIFREPDTCWQQERYWVPEKCSQDTSEGDWYMQLILPPDSLIVKIRLDTLWQIAESVWVEKDH